MVNIEDIRYNRCMCITENSKQNILILADRIFDASGELQPNRAILVNNGRISAVLPALDPASLPVEGNYKLIELPGLTLLPALVDCHVHLALNGVDFQAALAKWQEEEEWRPEIQRFLEVCLQQGLGLVRDGGDGGNIGLKARNLLKQGRIKGPQILACGQAIYKKGRYGSFLGPGVSDLREAQHMVASLAEQEVDWVKILVSGIVSFNEYGRVGAVQFSQAELCELVYYAHSLRLPVMAHASSDEAVTLAVNAGVDSVEHGYFISTASLKMMARDNIPWVPTVVPVANQVKTKARSNYSVESLDIIERTYLLQLEKILEASLLGVPLGIGTDAGASGVQHGMDHFQELNLFLQAGLSPLKVIQAATSTAARICGREKDFGTIEPGKKACLLGVRGNPLKELVALKQIEFRLYS